MDFLHNKKLIELIKVLLIILLLSLALKFLLPVITSAEFKAFVERIGIFGPLVVVFYTVLAQVVAPLSGTPALILGAALFGIWQTMIYLYLAQLISASIAFGISKRFGRRWVAKLVGKKTINEMDDFIDVSGTQVLILCRVFGFTLFDYISYAAGLTNITFKKYFSITLVFSLIPIIVFAYLFRNADFSSSASVITWLVALVTVGIIFSFFIKKYIKQAKDK